MKKAATEIRKNLLSLLSTYTSGRLIREGAGVSIVGKPNVGKSSLMNALLGRERAITSPEPGTTRDYIEEQISIKGITVRLTDTAGIRDAVGAAEKTGIKMAQDRAQSADLQILVIDGSESLCDGDMKMVENAPENTILAVNKVDLKQKSGAKTLCDRFGEQKTVHTSAKTGEGVEKLKETVRQTLMENIGTVESDEAALTGTRQKQAVETALEAVNAFLSLLEHKESPEILSIKVKEAMDSLGEITGETTTEEMLGVIFKKFCIGK